MRSAKDTRPGFSLVEMLTVLGILAIVLAIVIPVLGQARNAARKAATQALCSDVGSAINQFQIDNRRLPGYFSADSMGQTLNRTTRGFTQMENILIDLAGGVVGSGVALVPGQIIEVGPGTDPKSVVRIDVTRIGATTQTAAGASNKGYFRPDAKSFTAQTGPGQRFGNSSTALPVLVDAWNQPILAWAENDAAGQGAEFTRVDASAGKAKHYWGSNAGFLGATKLGRKGENQQTDSLIGADPASAPASVVSSLQGLLGNPAFPDKTPAPTGPLPTVSRGPVLLHSAGPTGEFLSKESRGGRLAAGSGNVLKFSANQDPLTGGAFDDLIAPAGN